MKRRQCPWWRRDETQEKAVAARQDGVRARRGIETCQNRSCPQQRACGQVEGEMPAMELRLDAEMVDLVSIRRMLVWTGNFLHFCTISYSNELAALRNGALSNGGWGERQAAEPCLSSPFRVLLTVASEAVPFCWPRTTMASSMRRRIGLSRILSASRGASPPFHTFSCCVRLCWRLCCTPHRYCEIILAYLWLAPHF